MKVKQKKSLVEVLEMYPNNVCLLTDSYKGGHWLQYQKGTHHVYSYMEARVGGKFDKALWNGLQPILKKYFVGKVLTKKKIEQADAIFSEHVRPGFFNKEGWMKMLKKHKGYLPVRIKAAPEGTVFDCGNVLMTIENTDKEFPWLTNYIESVLMHVWYPTTVGTLSLHMKEVILEYLEKTGTPDLINFKLHDFGLRGASSIESAARGGAAHLINFMGTDTVPALLLLKTMYKAQGMPGFSIDAFEHSTITSWGGPEFEVDALENMIDYLPEGLLACVGDSYDIINFCLNVVGKALKDKVLARKGTLVVRPDSGHPPTVVVEVLNALGKAFGYSTNAKGYKVLPDQVRVIQGDGINLDMVRQILFCMELSGWSADNIAFGCGGALLQTLSRDDLRFAIKCSSVVVNGQYRDVYKNPATDKTKASKRGRLKLIKEVGWKDDDLKNFRYKTVAESDPGEDELVTVFENGVLLKEYTLDEMRANAAASN